MFQKVLIANRGEIVGRIAKTLRRMNISSVAVFSDADRFTQPVMDADERVYIGPSPASESYLDIEAIIEACRMTGAQAVHPGYGFLSENVSFAERLSAEGIVFIGPKPRHLRDFGLKHTAREIAAQSGVPLLPGSALLANADEAINEASLIGYPVMLKSTAGGGGIGMQLCEGPETLRERFDSVQRTARSGFGDERLYLERFVPNARHVEVQIFGDGKGNVVALGERDCSLQRRNQKVLEETPAPGLSDMTRQRLHEAAVALGRAVSYESAGTVEFIFDVARDEFYFLEVNTRLQVEHPVTEEVFGIDLVEMMIRQASGEDVISKISALKPAGSAIEVRLYAENPAIGFRPSAGLLTEVTFPKDVRVDGWIETGSDVTAFYDPMLAKIIVTGQTRSEAIEKLNQALADTRIWGIETNLTYLRAIASSSLFKEGLVATSVLANFSFEPATIDVMAPGAQSTIQELPGRLGLWDVGVPPSGPMDPMSFRLANKIVGNDETLPALEMTARGASLRFNSSCVFCLVGAQMKANLDGVSLQKNQPLLANAGQTLTIGHLEGPGMRTYLAVRGGFAVPSYLGSKATFTLGAFGGHATHALKAGDVLHLGPASRDLTIYPRRDFEFPDLSHDWTLSVLYGPHGAPDFFLESDIETFFSSEYEVHFNSARTGVRLTGPKPSWAREDGGEAGLHPSNIHDNAYAIGSIDFTGDMPIILGPDGPSLGGFVCPAVVAKEDLWKLGQLKPGDKVKFSPVARPSDPMAGPLVSRLPKWAGSPVLALSNDNDVPVVYRRAGDDNLLVEYGPMALDIGLRLRIHLLAAAVRDLKLPGLIDMTPGIRSLQIHYDSDILPRQTLLHALKGIEASLGSIDEMTVPSRIVHLPLSWNDPQVILAMQKYQDLVYPQAPWCPSNIEFIRRINGLADEEAVKKIIFDANYLVMGLGDVYLGAPVATPIDPRHRLVTTKYNPARTWTPENAVGIGGAYMCIYGMEGPGGYQLFGRTIQMWNSWRSTDVFEPSKPWLLRFFDQIKFFPVSAEELVEARAAFPHGAYKIQIEETTFSFAEYKSFLQREADDIAAFKMRQQTAFESERQRWREARLDAAPQDDFSAGPPAATDIPVGYSGIFSDVPGNVWKVLVAADQSIRPGEAVVIIESMKMEIAISASCRGTVRSINVQPGQTVRAGDLLLVVDEGHA